VKIYHGFSEWVSEPKIRTVATLGNFDGVHRGHQAILQRLVEKANENKMPSVVITFDPVPKKVLSPDTAPPLIQTLDQRLDAFADLGIDSTIVVVFNHDFARKSPEEFVREYLVKLLRVSSFVVGQNFAFGHKKSGDIALLRRMGQENDFEVESVPEIRTDGTRISSTLIRQDIQQGRMEQAQNFLGRPFSLRGIVVKGEQLGGKIGIPTANLKVSNELVPGGGVYAAQALIGHKTYPSAVNVGFRPTVGGKNLTIEAHLIDFSGDLYGQEMELQFLKRIREEKRFSGIDELRNQILEDIETTRNYFSS
jgi:riboflavin kinase/FMN adenylyltransferase